MEELRLNKIEAEKFLSPADETLNTVRTVLQVLSRSRDVQAASPCDDSTHTQANFPIMTLCGFRQPSVQHSGHAFARGYQTVHVWPQEIAPAILKDVQGAGLLGLTAAFFGLHLEVSQLAGLLVGIGFVFTADQVPALPSSPAGTCLCTVDPQDLR